MTKREAKRQTMMFDALRNLGFTRDEAEQLRRISLTLHRWAERCCNEDIETRDDGSAWLTAHYGCGMGTHSFRIPNREAGALRRLEAILAPHKRRLTYYHQTDPRGAALYIVRLARLREYNKGKATPTPLECCYNSVGMAIY